MFKALFTSATGMQAQQLYVDTVANNLANVNTTAFKKNQIQFQDLLYEELIAPGTDMAQGFEVPLGLQIGSGVSPVSTTKIFSQGDLERTDRPLDMAINGERGFFRVQLPDGTTAYTRDGSFTLDSNRRVVTSDGLLLQPTITVPPEGRDLQVGIDGTVSVLTSDNPPTRTSLGTITLATFPNPAGLESVGGNLFRETPASGTPTEVTPGTSGTGELQNRFLERSNVQVVNELVDLIIAQRAYEVNSRAIRSADTMLATAAALMR